MWTYVLLEVYRNKDKYPSENAAEWFEASKLAEKDIMWCEGEWKDAICLKFSIWQVLGMYTMGWVGDVKEWFEFSVLGTLQDILPYKRGDLSWKFTIGNIHAHAAYSSSTLWRGAGSWNVPVGFGYTEWTTDVTEIPDSLETDPLID